ncbi:hypothetical protein IFM89_037879 [Coptis chinensis]|uniref:Ribulose bisphosphate carboxylase large subunit C-terminal domain-containing protein n=1 Tax=Coptis chinensis TaxID=261450 RepID=A0A835M1V1_9MAGN|nr:hypothetical protein IFM89_037879 [Coptis chinensis]
MFTSIVGNVLGSKPRRFTLGGSANSVAYVKTFRGPSHGEREITLGFVDLLRDDFIEKDQVAVFTSLKIGYLYRCVLCCFRGIHAWHMPALTEIFGDDSIITVRVEEL